MIKLIVGLGNPGLLYTKTRHNVGFIVVRAWAKRHGFRFKNDRRFLGKWAKGAVKEHALALLLPTTYMNLSGRAVARLVHFLKIPLKDLLVVADDVALPLGQVRLRPSGSSGGHNGLISIEQELSSADYPRLRVGIGRGEVLKDHVLGRFTKEELKGLEEGQRRAEEALALWLEQGIDRAMGQVNKKNSPEIG